MQTINYSKSHGSFIIKYLDENDLYEGTINVDDNSIKTELAKYIIDNEENSVFSYTTHIGSNENVVDILIIKKDIEIVFDEVNEETYFNYYGNDEFENIKHEISLNTKKIYFHFYYVPAEYKIANTFSNKIIYGLKKNLSDINKNIDDFNFFLRDFVKNFLNKFRDDLKYYDIIACVPSSEAHIFNNNNISYIIREISKNTKYEDGSQLLLRIKSIPAQKTQKKRYIETHLDSIKVVGSVKGKNIILIDDITTSGSSLKACKKLLLDAGAKSVICFAFGKSS